MINKDSYKFIISYLIPLYIHDIDDFFNYFNAVIKDRHFIINKDVMTLKKKDFISSIEINKDGFLYEKYQQYSNGKKYGDFYRYRPNGDIHIYCSNTHKKGCIYQYYERGNKDTPLMLEIYSQHVKSLKHGKGYGYRRDGTIHYESQVRNNELHGLSTTFYVDGCQRAIEIYNEGIRTYISVYNHSCHTDKKPYIYESHGLIDAETSLYIKRVYSDGNVMVKEYYCHHRKSDDSVEHRRHGLYKEWYENGQLAMEATYDNGVYNGPYKEWHENGQLAIESTYEDGHYKGLYKRWHENGQLHTYTTYKNRDYDGQYNQWYDNGQLRIDTTYINGRRNGYYKVWNRDGNLIKDQMFGRGAEIFYNVHSLFDQYE
jgi:antitoxin component YwqK of YwqJK toxin-antitoxin module